MRQETDLRLYLLGTPRLEYQGKPTKIARRKALALIVYLALAQQPQNRDSICGLLWPTLDQEHARASLRSTLPTLTHAVPIEWLITNGMTLALKSEVIWTDAQEFLDLLSPNRTHAHSLEILCDDCVQQLEQAVELYKGDFLEGFTLTDSSEYDHWQRAQYEWLRREFGDVLRRLAHARKHTHLESAFAYARRWLSLDPLNEPAHRLLMQLYITNGQRFEALRQYRQCVEVLDAELATPPEEETTRLYEMIQTNAVSKLSPPQLFPSVSSSILPPLPALVVGRSSALGNIKQRLGINSHEMRPITLIQGWPGVGKSTLVAKLAHDSEIAQQFTDGVLWASLGENPSVLNEILAWANALGLVEPGPPRRIEEISAQLTAVLRDKRMLLIVDDVWQTAHVAPFRVGGEACALVITSRLNEVANALAPTAHDLYRLSVLDTMSALDLLNQLTPETVTDYPDEARELVNDLEGLPLAIHVAGRLLHNEVRLGWGVAELLTELRTGASLLGAKIPGDMVGGGSETSPTVAALLQRSTEALDSTTRRCFALLGLFVPKPATFDLPAMSVAWDVDDARPIARLLVNRGLLEPVSGGRFQMHALLVFHARSILDHENIL